MVGCLFEWGHDPSGFMISSCNWMAFSMAIDCIYMSGSHSVMPDTT